MTRADWLDEALEFMRDPRVFFICNLYGSAGSFFLHTLVDGHPDLFTFIFDLRRAPVLVDHFSEHTRAEHLSALLDDNARLFDTGVERTAMNTLDKLGESRDRSIVVDRGVFTEYLLTILDHVEFNIRNLSLALAIAHNYARGIRPRTNTFVFYTHDLPRTDLFIRQFGCGSALALSRHPVNAYASKCVRAFRNHLLLAKAEGVSARQALGLALYRPSLIHDLEDAYRLLAAGAGPIGVVAIEELHANPKSSMEAIAAHLGVRFVPSLMESTIGGLKWWGSHFTRVHGFEPSLHREVDVATIGRSDVSAVLNMTPRLRARLGYGPSGRTSRIRAIQGRACGTRYPKDVVALLRNVWQRERAGARRARAAAVAVERVVKYVIGRTTFENRAMRRIAALDRDTPLGALQVLSPISPDSMAAGWATGVASELR